MTPKAIGLLLYLVESRGRLVTKDELMSAVWPDTFVEESNLTSYISILRKTLDEQPDGAEHIETIPKRGYRFVAPVQERTPQSAATQRTSLSPKTWTLCAVLLVTIAAATAAVWRSGNRRPTGIRSVAVLPFVNLSPENEDDYFSDGLTEELILLLTRVQGLRVVAWSSASQFRGREQDLSSIRENLKAGVILRGSVRRAAGRVRATAQLIETATGSYLWSEAFDRSLSARHEAEAEARLLEEMEARRLKKQAA